MVQCLGLGFQVYVLRYKVYRLGLMVQGFLVWSLGFMVQGFLGPRFEDFQALGFGVQLLGFQGIRYLRFQVQRLGFMGKGLGFRIWDLGVRVQCFRFWVFWFRVQCLLSSVLGLGVRVQAFWGLRFVLGFRVLAFCVLGVLDLGFGFESLGSRVSSIQGLGL